MIAGLDSGSAMAAAAVLTILCILPTASAQTDMPLCGVAAITSVKQYRASPKTSPLQEVEPNNTPAQGTPLPLGYGAAMSTELIVDGELEPPPIPQLLVPAAGSTGSIPLAHPTGILPGSSRSISFETSIDAHPPGGDFDFYRIDASAWQEIVLQVESEFPYSDMDLNPVVGLFDQTGRLVAHNDDDMGYDSFLRYHVPQAGAYYVCVGGYFPSTELFPTNPLSEGSGPGVGSTGDYRLTIRLDNAEVDYFTFQLVEGDAFGVNVVGGAGALSLRNPAGVPMMSSDNPQTTLPTGSPLPAGGNAGVVHVAASPGIYSLAVSGGAGPYTLEFTLRRAGLHDTPAGQRQIIFLDFDGAEVDLATFFNISPDSRTLSPLSAFLGDFGLAPTEESAVIDAIIETFEENLRDDLAQSGINGDYDSSGRPGEFALTILNSRDHPDTFGQANVSRVIIGGSIPELGVQTVGIAESIDAGNFAREETAVVLLDIMSQSPPLYDASINNFSLITGADRAYMVGRAIGNVASHEAAHLLGCYHDEFDDNTVTLMDRGGNYGMFYGFGPDAIYGTSDDVDIDFGVSAFEPPEGLQGIQNSAATTSFGLSTGTDGVMNAGDSYLLYR